MGVLMARMAVQYWRGVLTANDFDTAELSVNNLEFRALGLLGYAGTLNDRRRDFYRDRTQIDDLTTAIGRNVNDKGVQ